MINLAKSSTNLDGRSSSFVYEANKTNDLLLRVVKEVSSFKLIRFVSKFSFDILVDVIFFVVDIINLNHSNTRKQVRM